MEEGQAFEEEIPEPDESNFVEIDDDEPVTGEFVIDSSLMVPTGGRQLMEMIANCEAWMPGFKIELGDVWDIHVDVPKSVLPRSLQVVYGFIGGGDFLFQIILQLADFNWQHLPRRVAIVREGVKNITGETLMMGAVDKFFRWEFAPRDHYRVAPLVFQKAGEADPKRVDVLVSKGFSTRQARRALVEFDGNIDKAEEWLRMGGAAGDVPVPQRFMENRLMYFILEMLECLHDLPDHCVVCRDSVYPGIRPVPCKKTLCNYQVSEVGLGGDLIGELRRDPLAADLVLSLFATAVGTAFLTPAPPESFSADIVGQAIQTLPAIKDMCAVKDEAALRELLGDISYKLVRWVLFSNRAQLFVLPDALKLTEFSANTQFMSLVATPEKEAIFAQLKARHGSIWVFHGSEASRWHSIFRNGLRNLSGTNLMRVGAACGAGIYLGGCSSISAGYVAAGRNGYAKSALGGNLACLGLCEVANIPSDDGFEEPVYVNGVKRVVKGALKRHGGWGSGGILTCTMEEAVIVRFVLVGACGQQVTFDKSPPARVPKLRDLVEQFMSNK